MKKDEKYIGYLRYQGGSIRDGALDARKAGKALIGFDKILRYFLSKENPQLAKVDFEIPVRIKKGSWVSIIQENIGDSILLIMAIRYGDVYLKEFFKQAAREGLYQTGLAKDINESFRKAMLIACWIIKIYKHIGKSEESKIEDSNTQVLNSGASVILTNNKGEKLIIPKYIYDHYNQCPIDLLSQNAAIIDDGDTMEIGVSMNDKTTIESINNKEKWFFMRPKSTQLEDILPELENGKKKTLEGRITEVDEDNNSMVFSYKKINIECKPEKGGYIFRFKKKIISKKSGGIFGNVRITGRIDRIDSNGKQKKISIRIIEIEAIEGNQRELL